jgi:hypothetical protein
MSGPEPGKLSDQGQEQQKKHHEAKKLQDTLAARKTKDGSQSRKDSGVMKSDKLAQGDKGEKSKGRDRLNQTLGARNGKKKKEQTSLTGPPAGREQVSYKDDAYRPGISDRLPQSKPSEGEKATDQPQPVSMPGHEVVGLPNFDIRPQLNTDIARAVKLVRDNTQDYVSEVYNAVTDFEKYANNKIEKLDGKIKAGELAATLGDAILTVLAPEAKLAKFVSSEIGKNLVKLIYKDLKDELKKEVKQSSSADIKNLEQVISGLAQRTRDKAKNIKEHAVKEFENFTGPIREKISRGEPLYTEQEIFVGEIFEAPYDQELRDDAPSIEAALSRRGVPNPDNCYAEVLRSLITEFEKIYFEKTASQGEKIDMGYYGMNWYRGAPARVWKAAGEKADRYVKKRLQDRASS